MVNHGTLVNAIVGAIVGILLSFIPFSTVIGGAMAAFLEGPDHREGALAGAIAGVITFLPAAGIAVLAFAFVGVGTAFEAIPVGGAAFLIVAVLVAFTTILIYTVGLALVGGFLGAALARAYPDRRVSTRRTIGLSDRPRGTHSSAGPGAHRRAHGSPEWTGADDPQPWGDPHDSAPPDEATRPSRDRESSAVDRDDDRARWRERPSDTETTRDDGADASDADGETDTIDRK